MRWHRLGARYCEVLRKTKAGWCTLLSVALDSFEVSMLYIHTKNSLVMLGVIKDVSCLHFSREMAMERHWLIYGRATRVMASWKAFVLATIPGHTDRMITG